MNGERNDNCPPPIYTRSMTFDISDVTSLDFFALNDLIYDDYVLVKINGYQIYAGPYGGNQLKIVPLGVQPGNVVQVDDSSKRYPVDLRRSNVINGANIDLLPYLLVGQNKIEVRTLVGGHGEVALTFKTRMACREIWESSCSGLEARQ